ncbi:MAG: hypothetical protein H8E94_07375 [Alphaproteobacteria bacterium]|nr:hypothetical protein [Alphaproteobacteria bacterium]
MIEFEMAIFEATCFSPDMLDIAVKTPRRFVEGSRRAACQEIQLWALFPNENRCWFGVIDARWSGCFGVASGGGVRPLFRAGRNVRWQGLRL